MDNDKGSHCVNQRKLNHRFYYLPYTMRLKVAIYFNLLQDDDEGIEDAELYKRFFHRARKKHILEQVWKTVENLYNVMVEKKPLNMEFVKHQCKKKIEKKS